MKKEMEKTKVKFKLSYVTKTLLTGAVMEIVALAYIFGGYCLAPSADRVVYMVTGFALLGVGVWYLVDRLV